MKKIEDLLVRCVHVWELKPCITSNDTHDMYCSVCYTQGRQGIDGEPTPKRPGLEETVGREVDTLTELLEEYFELFKTELTEAQIKEYLMYALQDAAEFGLDQGHEDGYEEGYNDGWEEGNEDGYERGLEEGRERPW